ncbi:hypothetical protein WA026_015248 [Henosepilachna vigintioctopunctata]|uniref:Uncharacterized protein n=1 Tax=Henosepilachna vigintioctopunctata TaxID=420089 RepID=A0AAW1TUJ8_9CUCU
MPRQSLLSPSFKKKWDPDQMLNAIEASKDKSHGLQKVYKNVFCAEVHIERLKDSEESLELLAHKPLGRKSMLPPLMEKKLVEYILLIESIYYGLTGMDVRKMAYQLVARTDIENKFRNEVAGRA